MDSKARLKDRRSIYVAGLRDGVPIALGYFAVSFSLGVFAKSMGINAVQGFIASALCMASAGQYAGFTLIGADAALLEIALVTLITNARYMLMSAALSQKLDPKMPFFHRFLMGAEVTDEHFGIGIAYPGYLSPFYIYGAITVTVPGWSLGTALGIIAGNILPLRAVSALSVAIYGMFIAVIVPEAKKNRVVLVSILVSFIASFAFSELSFFDSLSAGSKTIILTVGIASVFALLFPVKESNIDDALERQRFELEGLEREENSKKTEGGKKDV